MPVKQGVGASGSQKVGFYAWYVLFALVVVYAFSLIDRQIISILAEDIKADLALTDAQLGFLYGTAFAMFYAIFGLPLGRLADRWRRGLLMAIGLALWSLMTGLSGLASSYAMLAAARIGVGIGEASASPAAYSMLAGLFPAKRRALAIAIYSSGAYIGIGLSLPLGGWLSDSWNAAYPVGEAPFGLAGWQAAFLAVGLPGLLIALWIVSLREPPRIGADGTVQPIVSEGAWRSFLVDLMAIVPPFTLLSAARHRNGLRANVTVLVIIAAIAALLVFLTGDTAQWVIYGLGLYAVASWALTLRYSDAPAARLIFGNRPMWFLILGTGFAGVTMNTFMLWASPFAIRTYGVAAADVGPLIGIPGAIAAAVGSVFGGHLSDRWKASDPRGRLFVCMVGVAVPVPLILFMFTRDSLQAYLLVAPFVYFFASMVTASAVTALQDFVLPRMFGTVGAIFLVSQTLVGISLGPYVSGKIATVTGSLQMGIFGVLVGPLIALFLLWRVGTRAALVEANKLDWAVAAGEKTAVGAVPN